MFPPIFHFSDRIFYLNRRVSDRIYFICRFKISAADFIFRFTIRSALRLNTMYKVFCALLPLLATAEKFGRPEEHSQSVLEPVADLAGCPYTEIGKLKPKALEKKYSSENSIELSWTLNCFEERVVSGYVVNYCRVTDSNSQNCTDEPIRMNVKHRPSPGCNITDLDPFTWYSIRIQLVTPESSGPFSEPYVVRTLEGSPSSPSRLSFGEVTNTTVRLSWYRPDHLNGPLTVYILKYNNRTQEMCANYSERIEYLFQGLRSSEKYTVQVKACTNAGCSNYSNAIEFTTDVGKPSEVTQLAEFENGDIRILTWAAPMQPGGHVDYYELRQLGAEDGNDQPTEKIVRIRERKCTLISRGCHSARYAVRAVNIVESPSRTQNQNRTRTVLQSTADSKKSVCLEEDDDLTHYPDHFTPLPGDWSSSLQILCKGGFYFIPIILTTSVVLFIYGAFVVRKRLRKMLDIHVELPLGLEDIKQESVPMPTLTDRKCSGNFVDCPERLTDSEQCGSYNVNITINQNHDGSFPHEVGKSSKCSLISSIFCAIHTADLLQNTQKRTPNALWHSSELQMKGSVISRHNMWTIRE